MLAAAFDELAVAIRDAEEASREADIEQRLLSWARVFLLVEDVGFLLDLHGEG
jgi:hypothetical protein